VQEYMTIIWGYLTDRHFEKQKEALKRNKRNILNKINEIV